MTKLPRMRRRDDGYYVCQWVDAEGKRRTRTFGNSYDDAHERFGAFMDQWRAGEVQSLRGPTLRAAFETFLVERAAYYRRPDGSPTNTLSCFRCAIDGEVALHGDRPLTDLDTLRAVAIRNEWIEQGLARSTINVYLRRICEFLTWCVGKGWVRQAEVDRLRAQGTLSLGRAVLRDDGAELMPEEREPQRGVADEYVTAVLEYLDGRRPLQAAVLRVMDITGMRPSEAIGMTADQLTMNGEVWLYRPRRHKTARHQDRSVYLGPQAQAVIRPLLGRDLTARIFDGFGVACLSQTVKQACRQLDIPHWSPRVLRHRAAARLRAQFGSEVARIMLGHSTVATTEMYGERDKASAIRAAMQVG